LQSPVPEVYNGVEESGIAGRGNVMKQPMLLLASLAITVAWTAYCATGVSAAELGEVKKMAENIHWYGHDAFRIEDGTKQIYIDPWNVPRGAPKADVILVTHSHFDHFSEPDITALSTKTTKVVGPADVARKLGALATAVKPGQSITLDALKVTTIPAYNVAKQFHPRSSNWVGYVITLSSGMTVYHAGDTDGTPEMKALTNVDVALLPVSGKYVMTAEEAAGAANAFKPKVAIPMHYGAIIGGPPDAEKFKKAFKGETVIKQQEK
jgi:L-ascorbate metabolism protein UlaG (beta-lactamase superfamily)